MAITGFLHKLQFGGALFTQEEWSCGLHLHTPLEVDIAPNVFQAMLTTWMDTVAHGHSSNAHLDYIKCNRIDPTTGKYADQGASQTQLVTGVQGQSPAGPGQLSLCVSLRTAIARGRGSHGRFYPPSGSDYDVDAEGRLPVANASASAVAARQLIDSINALDLGANGPLRVVVFSKIGQLTQPVTHIMVGRIIDTQRRRRASLPEEYSTQPVAP